MRSKNILGRTCAALTLGLACAAVTPAALAADYDSGLLVQLNNLRISSGTLGGDVTASFESLVFDQSSAATGGAWAAADPYLFALDGLEQDQNVTGSAYSWGSTAFSALQTNGYIHLANTSAAEVVFTFDYAITGAAHVYGPGLASAYGSAEIFDSVGATSIFRDMQVDLDGTTSATIQDYGSFSLTLASGATADISVLVSNHGTGTLPVPEPGTCALMALGLGLLGLRRPRRA